MRVTCNPGSSHAEFLQIVRLSISEWCGTRFRGSRILFSKRFQNSTRNLAQDGWLPSSTMSCTFSMSIRCSCKNPLKKRSVHWSYSQFLLYALTYLLNVWVIGEIHVFHFWWYCYKLPCAGGSSSLFWSGLSLFAQVSLQQGCHLLSTHFGTSNFGIWTATTPVSRGQANSFLVVFIHRIDWTSRSVWRYTLFALALQHQTGRSGFAIEDPSLEVVSCPRFDMAPITRRSLNLEKWLPKYVEKHMMLNKHKKWFHSFLDKLPLVGMSASCFLVSTYLIWILGSKLTLSNNQSRATLWVLDTCLNVGLRPLMIILITASLSSKMYNWDSPWQERVLVGTQSTSFNWLTLVFCEHVGSWFWDHKTSSWVEHTQVFVRLLERSSL